MSHLESHITQREYYKIFSGTNQEDSDKKIHLGYEASTAEIVLKKDKTTYFHVPYFADNQHIQDSNLIGAGAIPGPVPAGSDRIFKKLAGYGNSTPFGNSQQRQDGTWLCSWLYAVSSEPPQWLDRYYNPGTLSYEEALRQNINPQTYQKHDPYYYDVPSVLTLEPGSWYQYFHHGEETSVSFVNTFAGKNKTNLRLNIDDWLCTCSEGTTTKDSSIYQNTINIQNPTADWVFAETIPGYLDRNSLSFNTKDFIDCQVNYTGDYNLKNEFTLAIWVKSNDWQESPSTQFLGNLSRSGYSLFFNNLKYYPFYVIPETTYGHFFLFNQEGRNYEEKNVQAIYGQPINFFNTHINSEGQIIAIQAPILGTNSSLPNKIYKFNHLGELLNTSQNENYTAISMMGIPKTSIIDGEDNTIVVTTSGTYIFNQELILTSFLSSQPYSFDEQICFDLSGTLIRQVSCLDVKVDSNNKKWHIDLNENLFCQDVKYPGISQATNIHIDPNGDLWVLAGINTVYKINTTTKQIKSTFNIGTTPEKADIKNISFIYTYERTTNKKEWYALIYHSEEKTLYRVTIDGKILNSTFLPQGLNIIDAETARQDKNFLTFKSKGDFTGYERNRIFNKVKYNNKIQVQFKLATDPPVTTGLSRIYKVSVPVDYLNNQEWHLIVATLKNKKLSLYINNSLRDTIDVEPEFDVTYIYKNNLIVGCPSGKSENLNKEIKSQSLIWDGYIDTIRIYDYAIEPAFLKYFLRERIQGNDIVWNLITPKLQYIESIERFFKHRPPGHKSNFFNIKINHSTITDPEIRGIIEQDIRLAVQQAAPANTELLNIEWY